MTYLKLIETKFRPLLAVALIVSLIAGVETIGLESKQALAQDSNKPTRKAKRVDSINTHHPSRISKVQEAFEREDHAEVSRLLDDIESDPKLSIAEKASAANYRGNLCFANDDLDCALAEFKKVLAMREGIPEGFYNQMLYVVAQVFFSQEKYQEALHYAQTWFKTQDTPSSDAFMLLGQAHYMLENYDKALPYVISGLEKRAEFKSVPKEGWLNLLSAIYRKTDQFEKMIPVLKQLIKHYPKETYQLTLDEVHKQIDQKRP